MSRKQNEVRYFRVKATGVFVDADKEFLIERLLKAPDDYEEVPIEEVFPKMKQVVEPPKQEDIAEVINHILDIEVSPEAVQSEAVEVIPQMAEAPTPIVQKPPVIKSRTKKKE